MKRLAQWGITIAVVAFLGYVMYSSVAPATVSCEVCLVFGGEEVCRMGAGPTPEVAANGGAGERVRRQRHGNDRHRAVQSAPAGTDDVFSVTGRGHHGQL